MFIFIKLSIVKLNRTITIMEHIYSVISICICCLKYIYRPRNLDIRMLKSHSHCCLMNYGLASDCFDRPFSSVTNIRDVKLGMQRFICTIRCPILQPARRYIFPPSLVFHFLSVVRCRCTFMSASPAASWICSTDPMGSKTVPYILYALHLLW